MGNYKKNQGNFENAQEICWKILRNFLTFEIGKIQEKSLNFTENWKILESFRKWQSGKFSKFNRDSENL